MMMKFDGLIDMVAGRNKVMWTVASTLPQLVDGHLGWKPVSSAKSAILATGDE